MNINTPVIAKAILTFSISIIRPMINGPAIMPKLWARVSSDIIEAMLPYFRPAITVTAITEGTDIPPPIPIMTLTR